MEDANSYYLEEDVGYLKDWLRQAEELARDIGRRAREKGTLAIFTISSTAKMREDFHPYLTPLREITHGFIGGAVVFSQTQGVLLSTRIDGLVDKVLVDVEKKIGITIDIDYSVLKEFGVSQKLERPKSRVFVEMGNLGSACVSHVNKSTFYQYKPNDITVEAVWHLLESRLGMFSGKKIAVIGCGNIGFKLGLKLVECGATVELVRRDLSKGMLMANTINIVKPASTIAMANYNPNPLHASLFSDVILGCTNGTAAITWEMIQSMKSDGLVVDVGKGSVTKDAVQKAILNGISIIRCDVSSAIDGHIATMLRNKEITVREMGRREIGESVFVVSGGYPGLENDIVVDNYRKPHRILGIANGMGDMKGKLSQKDKERLVVLKSEIKQKKYDKAEVAST